MDLRLEGKTALVTGGSSAGIVERAGVTAQ
jgi:hypothetical protein